MKVRVDQDEKTKVNILSEEIGLTQKEIVSLCVQAFWHNRNKYIKPIDYYTRERNKIRYNTILERIQNEGYS